MKQGAILIVSIFYCAFFMGQELKFSRNFRTIKKNVPLAIINNNQEYFYLLRYNKLAHDLIVERRRKSNAEMINISPLKMDSVNARSYNYENLDYLFFADQKQAYVVFEKVTATKRSVFLKSCDTNGRVGPFIHIASMERTGTLKEFYFTLRKDHGGRILIIGTKVFNDNSVNNSVYLYDAYSRTIIWEKKLPPENSNVGYAREFNCDSAGNLYYFVVNSRVVEYRRQFVNHYQRMMPVYHYDSVTLRYQSFDGRDQRSTQLNLRNFLLLNGLHLFKTDSVVLATVHYSKRDPSSGLARSYFFNQAFTPQLGMSFFEATTPLNQSIADQLEFFDGGDTKEAADKNYLPLWQGMYGSSCFQISGREEENFSKEMIFWHSDISSGRVIGQSIIPRKIFYFAGRSRFRGMGAATTVTSADTVFTFVLEHVSNEKVLPQDFNYAKFHKQEYATYASLACYYYVRESEMKKKVILKNIDFDCIPLNYVGNQRDVLFFQIRGTVERFVTLKLSRF